MEVSVILLLILFSMPPLIRAKSRSRGDQLVNGPVFTIPVSGRPKRSVKEVDYSNGGVRSTNSSPTKVNVLTTYVRVRVSRFHRWHQVAPRGSSDVFLRFGLDPPGFTSKTSACANHFGLCCAEPHPPFPPYYTRINSTLQIVVLHNHPSSDTITTLPLEFPESFRGNS